VRIAQVATLATPVRQEGSGSIEHLVWLLTRDLTALGHDVTVFAAPGSQSAGQTVAALPGTYAEGGAPGDWQFCESENVAAAVAAAAVGKFDVIHSHAYLWGLPLQRLSPVPLVHTLHTWVSDDHVLMRRLHPTATVVGISDYQWSAWPQDPPTAVVRHGVDVELPDPVPAEPYLLWLGRFLPDKGPVEAIEVARELGMPLHLAGPADSWYNGLVRPHVDGRTVIYDGFVSGAAKHRLLARAAAVLYPVRTLEPFGLVLAEAAVRGVPVAALAKGAVPELVQDGVTGHLSPSRDTLAGAVHGALQLDRAAVAAAGRRRFSSHRMAREYAQVFAAAVRR